MDTVDWDHTIIPLFFIHIHVLTSLRPISLHSAQPRRGYSSRRWMVIIFSLRRFPPSLAPAVMTWEFSAGELITQGEYQMNE